MFRVRFDVLGFNVEPRTEQRTQNTNVEPGTWNLERETWTDMFLYYVGRSLQLAGMWLLLVDVVTAGPQGPDAKLFGYGVAVFIVGWLIVRKKGRANP
jgi:hypothetical protein